MEEYELDGVVRDDLVEQGMDDEWKEKYEEVRQKLPCVEFLCPGHEY